MTLLALSKSGVRWPSLRSSPGLIWSQSRKEPSWDGVLFLIFINNLPDNIRSYVRLFADDCVLYRNIKSLTDCQILQDDLNSLAQWETDWQLKFNVAKCHSLRVTRHLPSNQMHFNYSIHQQTLEQVRSAKYLGLTITNDLEWGQHVSEISRKATKTLVFPRWNMTLAPRHTKEVAYKILVRPQLEYAAPIWHPYNETETKKKVEKVQKTAARWTCRRWCRRYVGQTRMAIPGGPQGEVLLNFLLQHSLRCSVS